MRTERAAFIRPRNDASPLAGFCAETGLVAYVASLEQFHAILLLALVLTQSVAIVPIAAVADTASTGIAKNPTDLPAYPNLWKASVMGGGKGVATIYNAASHDAYDTVLAWYRSKLVGASEQESGYVKDLITFSLPHGEQVVVQRSGADTLIALTVNAR